MKDIKTLIESDKSAQEIVEGMNESKVNTPAKLSAMLNIASKDANAEFDFGVEEKVDGSTMSALLSFYSELGKLDQNGELQLKFDSMSYKKAKSWMDEVKGA